ncbi:fumarylpyruvate hydrolase [Paracoccus alkenifer]|uniref:Fumarylpyruvate hydrolase n=2 Tax=Paracoccus alkenifer TaxID=65735 RepID=A0A1H6MWT3_9RHOB|nr:fumarylacetoacetate hydrolase family protein [Paracoccus alkenifer]SEI02489.1 fumarylpyruvate hydrolase [Paracoccus alkenifer]
MALETALAPLFPFPQLPAIPLVDGSGLFPVRRIFCVGRNYAAHAAEMGDEVDREAPFYFTKSVFALHPGGGMLPYACGTGDYHHEVELVVALGRAGFRVPVAQAGALVCGHAVGLDMTRRDLQALAKDRRRPWDVAKDVEHSAVIGPITPAGDWAGPENRRISLSVNGVVRQAAPLSDMVWSIPELIADLSRYYHLQPGDLIYTGTPAGVGAVQPGDRLRAEVEGLEPLELVIGPLPE